MSRPRVPSSLVRPTLDTLFHIDYEWWKRTNSDLELYLTQHLCPEHRKALAAEPASELTLRDWIDPETGQVHRVDPLRYALLSHCSRQPDYITDRTSLVDAVFRVLLATGNRPLTATELAERIGRPGETILRTLSGAEVYRGVRPYSPEG